MVKALLAFALTAPGFAFAQTAPAARPSPTPAAASTAASKPTATPAPKHSATPTPRIAPVPELEPVAVKIDSPKVVLKQADVSNLVLKQSDRATEANLKSELPRVDLARVLKDFDWFLRANSGYERSRFESLSGVGNIEDQILKSDVSLTKRWTTGTTTSLSWLRNSYRSEYSPLSPTFTTLPTEQTQDIFGFTFEQALWRNSFGVSDRDRVRAAEMDMNAALVTRAQDLQAAVLEGLRAYWTAYISQENMRQSLKAIERYENLVSTVRRKSGLGFSAPGELSQVSAELELRRQNAKTSGATYLRDADRLVELLRLPLNADITFEIPHEINPPPRLSAVELEKLRRVRSQQLKTDAAQARVESAESEEHPAFAFVGQVYGSGIEERAADSVGEALSGSRPKYYMGVKFEHNFGSGVQNEETVSRKAQAELEKLRLERMKLQTQNELWDSERQTRTLYAQAVSAREQMQLRERAYNEINRAYSQGRTDINFVVEALNQLFAAEVSFSRALGDYQIALASWAAGRDELIPDDDSQGGAR